VIKSDAFFTRNNQILFMIKFHQRLFFTAILGLSFISAGNTQTIDQMREHPGIHQIESELHQNIKSAPDESIPLSEVADLQPRIAKTTTHEVFGYLPYWQYSAYSSLNYQLLTTVAYFSAEITSTGGITNMHDWPVSALVNKAHTNGVRVVLVATFSIPARWRHYWEMRHTGTNA